MNNYYTLIYLTDHINASLNGSIYRLGISPHRNVWEGFFSCDERDQEELRLIFSTHPGEIALFTDRYRSPKKSNVVSFFDSLKGKRLLGAELATGDRLITFRFEDDSQLLFQLFGNRANLFMVNSGEITDAFKDRNRQIGTAAPVPRKEETKAPPKGEPDARKRLLHHDQKLPRHLLGPLIRHHKLEEAGEAEISRFAAGISAALSGKASFRIVKNGGLCLLSDELLPVETTKRFEQVNDAIRYCYYHTSHLRRFGKRMNELKEQLEKALGRAEKALQQLEDADLALKRADSYEKMGHLLMANAHREQEPHSDTIRVTDLYNADRELSITLKPELSLSENAGHYYDRSAKAKRRVEESRRREKQIRREIDEMHELRNSLQKIGKLYELEEWKKEKSGRLEALGLLKQKEQKSDRPWRTTRVDGYEVWIGKNARSNDRLTAGADKEDLWLHARGAGGSHVVIRMNNRSGKPPAHVVERVAAHAAWHSKLRGSKLVPVIVTKKKYVTKPKGAPAGSVRVGREEVLMVTPMKPDK